MARLFVHQSDNSQPHRGTYKNLISLSSRLNGNTAEVKLSGIFQVDSSHRFTVEIIKQDWVWTNILKMHSDLDWILPDLSRKRCSWCWSFLFVAGSILTVVYKLRWTSHICKWTTTTQCCSLKLRRLSLASNIKLTVWEWRAGYHHRRLDWIQTEIWDWAAG